MQFPDNHTYHCHHHAWVCCFNTRNFMISCMSSVLIFMSYCYFNIILSNHLRSSEQLFISRNFLIVVAFSYLTYFFFLNLDKVSKQYTRDTSSSFSQQVPGLSNRCTFALANGLAGRFISRYWVSWIGFGLRPSRELVWHLSTQVNNGLLAV